MRSLQTVMCYRNLLLIFEYFLKQDFIKFLINTLTFFSFSAL